AAAATAAAAGRLEARLLGRAVHGEGGELAQDVRRGAVGAGDLLLAADELLEVRLALHAHVFVDRHRVGDYQGPRWLMPRQCTPGWWLRRGAVRPVQPRTGKPAWTAADPSTRLGLSH